MPIAKQTRNEEITHHNVGDYELTYICCGQSKCEVRMIKKSNATQKERTKNAVSEFIKGLCFPRIHKDSESIYHKSPLINERDRYLCP